MYFVFPLNRCWNDQKIQSCGDRSAYLISCLEKETLPPLRFPQCKLTEQDDDNDDSYADDYSDSYANDYYGSYDFGGFYGGGEAARRLDASWEQLLDDDYGSVDHAAIFTDLKIKYASSSNYQSILFADLWLSPSSNYQESMVTDVASCTAQLCQIFTHDGVFESRGDADEVSLYPRLSQSFTGDFQILASIIKDSDCDDHFLIISNSSTGVNFDWNSVPGQITFVFDCGSKEIYGFSTSSYQTCNSYATYDLRIGLVNGVAYFNDTLCGNMTMAINFPGPYYLYIGADFDQWRSSNDDELTGSDFMYCSESPRFDDSRCGVEGDDVKKCGGTNYGRVNTGSCPFQVCGGQRVFIDLAVCIGDTYMRLYNGDGNMIGYNDDSEGASCSYLEFALPPAMPCEELSVHVGCYDAELCTGIVNVSVVDDPSSIKSNYIAPVDAFNSTDQFQFSCPSALQSPGQTDMCTFEICSGYYSEIKSTNCSMIKSRIELFSYDMEPFDSVECGGMMTFQGFSGCRYVYVNQTCPSWSTDNCTLQSHVSIIKIPELQIQWGSESFVIGNFLNFTVTGGLPDNQYFYSDLSIVLYSADILDQLESCDFWDYGFYNYIEMWYISEFERNLTISSEAANSIPSYGGSYRVMAFYTNLNSDLPPRVIGQSSDIFVAGQERFSVFVDGVEPKEKIRVVWNSSIPLEEEFQLELLEHSKPGDLLASP